MIFGFNTEVKIGDHVYHVQTEDHGGQKHLLETTVYMGGRLVHRRKVSYEELLESPNFSEADVRGRLEEQHRGVIEELRSGSLTFEIPPTPPKPAPKPAAAKPAAAPPAKPAAPTPPKPAPRPAAVPKPAASPTMVSPPRPKPEKPADVTPPAMSPVAQPGQAQLLNPASWYAAGTATLKIDVKSKANNEPLAEAMLMVVIQSPTGPINFAAKSDSRGRVELVFPLPKMGPAGADVIIKTPGTTEDEIRYSLKPTSADK